MRATLTLTVEMEGYHVIQHKVSTSASRCFFPRTFCTHFIDCCTICSLGALPWECLPRSSGREENGNPPLQCVRTSFKRSGGGWTSERAFLSGIYCFAHLVCIWPRSAHKRLTRAHKLNTHSTRTQGRRVDRSERVQRVWTRRKGVIERVCLARFSRPSYWRVSC